MKLLCLRSLWLIALMALVVEVRAADDTGPTDTTAAEAAIRANIDKYLESYNRRDSGTMADMWSPDAIYMDPASGEQVVGRDNIKKFFDEMFAGMEDAQLALKIDSIDFVSPNVAIEKGSAVVSYSDFPPEVTTYSAVHVKRDGKWYLDRVSEEEVAPPPPSHYEQLKDLEWLVGSWVDSDEEATIETTIEWTKNQNFLRRSFAVVIGDRIDMSGVQLIGWDASENKIRSWTFDSEGGFGEATWTRTGDQWFIQNKNTLADGRKGSALNTLTYVDDNAFTWSSVNREIDGELLPNVAEVTVIRAPSTEAAADAGVATSDGAQ